LGEGENKLGAAVVDMCLESDDMNITQTHQQGAK